MSDEQPPPAAVPDQPQVTIGDIGVSQSAVYLPSGRFPLRGSTWTVSDMSHTEEKISTAGIVLAIVGFFLICFLALLFLLMKEKQTTGFVQVTVQGNGFSHTALIPAAGPHTVAYVTQQVNWARSLASA